MSCRRKFAIGVRLVFCLDTYLLRKWPPTRGKPQRITRCTQVLFTLPENPFCTRQSHVLGCSITVCSRSDDLPHPSTRRFIRGLILILTIITSRKFTKDQLTLIFHLHFFFLERLSEHGSFTKRNFPELRDQFPLGV